MQVSATLIVRHTSTLSAEQREELQRLLELGTRRRIADESEECDRMVVTIEGVAQPKKTLDTFLTLFRMLPRRLTKDLEYDVTFHFIQKEV